MERVPQSSSSVVSLGYDPAAKLLEVEFRGGRVYQYADVPPDVYAELTAPGTVQDPTPSVGRRFQALIRAGGYSVERIESEPEGR